MQSIRVRSALSRNGFAFLLPTGATIDYRLVARVLYLYVLLGTAILRLPRRGV